MSLTTLRTILGLVFLVHGIGHSMALLPPLNISSTKTWRHRSWLLSGILGDKLSRALVMLLFGATLIGFIAAGLGLFDWLVLHAAWQTLAVISSVLGLVALFLFWNAFVAFIPNKNAAILVNVATLWVLLGSGSLSETIQNL